MLEEENNLQGQMLFFYSIIIKLHDSYSPGKTVDTPKKKKNGSPFSKTIHAPLHTRGRGKSPLDQFRGLPPPFYPPGDKKTKIRRNFKRVGNYLGFRGLEHPNVMMNRFLIFI